MGKKPPKKVQKKWQRHKIKAITAISALMIVVSGVIGSLLLDSTKAAYTLTWEPPSGYQNYPVKNAANTSSTQSISGGGGDMWVKLPSTPVGPITFTSCRNVVLIGGQINLPKNSGPGTDMRGIYINGCSGTVHIEGVLINGDIATAEGDGIAIKAPDAIVQVQNVRMNKLYGGYDTANHNHSDIIQPWGGVKELRVDYLTGSSNYQGFQINDDLAHIGKVTIKNTNVGDSGVAPPDGKGGYYLWMKCSTNTSYNFSNFYLNPRSGRTLNNSIWGSDCGLSVSGNIASFSNSNVSGKVLGGKPSADFVPAGTAGIGYTSPGYGGVPTTPTTPGTPTTPTPPTTPSTPPPADTSTPNSGNTTSDSNTTNTNQPTVSTAENATDDSESTSTDGDSSSTAQPVSGTVTVDEQSTAAIVKKEIYINGSLYKTIDGSEIATVDTSELQNGEYTVTVKATDVNGVVTESTRQLTVDNPAPTQTKNWVKSSFGMAAITMTILLILGYIYYVIRKRRSTW